jgi:hypothetical protein
VTKQAIGRYLHLPKGETTVRILGYEPHGPEVVNRNNGGVVVEHTIHNVFNPEREYPGTYGEMAK